jgi:hypothetical protein
VSIPSVDSACADSEVEDQTIKAVEFGGESSDHTVDRTEIFELYLEDVDFFGGTVDLELTFGNPRGVFLLADGVERFTAMLKQMSTTSESLIVSRCVPVGIESPSACEFDLASTDVSHFVGDANRDVPRF